jgi:uncharacterized protein (DUF362 family)
MIVSEDLVAADAVGARHLGKDPSTIRHIMLAEEAGLGVAGCGKVEVMEV